MWDSSTAEHTTEQSDLRKSNCDTATNVGQQHSRAYAIKCMEFCQALASQGTKFSFNLTTGLQFSFSLDTREFETSTSGVTEKSQEEEVDSF